ncbi:MAG: transcriptional regulator [Pirellulales bacterium]|nr:transcriptional regulator [Pirellulales bacterium]
MAKKKPAVRRKTQGSEGGKSRKARPDRDRRVRQHERMARVLKVLELVQSRGRWNALAIAEEIGCSERTVYRDLEVLEYAGVPWYFDEADQCYRVRPDYRFPVFGLTEEEALGQALATALTKTPGLDIGPGAAATTRKLQATSAGEIRDILADAAQLISVLDLKLADHSKHREEIKTVQFALLEGRQITGLYESPYQAEPVQLRLHPYRLCLIKSAWYIVARQADADQPRTYRVARFKTLRPLDQPADVPEGFDLKAYFGNAWAVFRGEKTCDVEIWFTPEAAKVVTETTWHHTQKVKWQKDGSIVLTFRVDGLEEITNWVLGWAGQAKVLEPGELRRMVCERLRRAIEIQNE